MCMCKQLGGLRAELVKPEKSACRQRAKNFLCQKHVQIVMQSENLFS